MTYSDIIQHRLVSQQIVATNFVKPHEMVKWQMAMQAQDFSMAAWAIGLRLPHVNYVDIEKAFNKGLILRTRFMRTTWHFISPDDIRCMLDLIAPRAHLTNDFSYRKYELDAAALNQSKDVMIRALEGGRNKTRLEMMIFMKKEGITVDRMRFTYMMMHAELEKLICSGPRRGKQHTYALLDERVPPAPVLSREEALAELASRYFASHGPATLHDFSWWSGLAEKDAQAGIDMLDDRFERVRIDDAEYIFIPQVLPEYDRQKASFLLPDYDEYGVSYRNRTFIHHSDYKNKSTYIHTFALDGLISGNWKAVEERNQVNIKTVTSQSFNGEQEKLLAKAVRQYKAFVEPEKLYHRQQPMVIQGWFW